MEPNTSTPHHISSRERRDEGERHEERHEEEVRPEIQIVPHRLLSERRGLRLIEELKTVGLVSRIGYAGPGDMIGYIWVEVYGFHSETMERIRAVCDEYLPFGYDLSIGRFTKYRKTVSDYIREDMMRRLREMRERERREREERESREGMDDEE